MWDPSAEMFVDVCSVLFWTLHLREGSASGTLTAAQCVEQLVHKIAKMWNYVSQGRHWSFSQGFRLYKLKEKPHIYILPSVQACCLIWMADWSGPSSLTCHFFTKVFLPNGFQRDVIEFWGRRKFCLMSTPRSSLSMLIMPGVIDYLPFRHQIRERWLAKLMMLCAYIVSAIGRAAALSGQCYYRPRRHQQEGMNMVFPRTSWLIFYV